MSPALAGGFLTTAPPGKPPSCILMLGGSWGAFVGVVCEVTFVCFELTGDRLEVIEDGKQRKQDIRLFILGLVYF